MAVTGFDQNFGIDGHAKAFAQFKRAHEENSAGILNAAEGKPVDAPRPAYDPNHEDNQWPRMVFHPVKGEMTIGTTLKGMASLTPGDKSARKATLDQNLKELDAALKGGYRKEPYPKPIPLAMDPASEKAAQKLEVDNLKGQNAALLDHLQKLEARLNMVEKG